MAPPSMSPPLGAPQAEGLPGVINTFGMARSLTPGGASGLRAWPEPAAVSKPNPQALPNAQSSNADAAQEPEWAAARAAAAEAIKAQAAAVQSSDKQVVTPSKATKDKDRKDDRLEETPDESKDQQDTEDDEKEDSPDKDKKDKDELDSDEEGGIDEPEGQRAARHARHGKVKLSCADEEKEASDSN